MANNYLSWSRYSDIPNGPDKKLFAVDVVYFVMIDRWPMKLNLVLPRDIDGTDVYRERVYAPCTGIIKEAVVHLASEMYGDVENRFIAYFLNNTKINEEVCNRQLNELANEFSAGGDFSCETLLRYAVCISLLAGHFYIHGVTEARRLATNLVHSGLPTRDFENSDYWDELAAAAEKIVKRKETQ